MLIHKTIGVIVVIASSVSAFAAPQGATPQTIEANRAFSKGLPWADRSEEE